MTSEERDEIEGMAAAARMFILSLGESHGLESAAAIAAVSLAVGTSDIWLAGSTIYSLGEKDVDLAARILNHLKKFKYPPLLP